MNGLLLEIIPDGMGSAAKWAEPAPIYRGEKISPEFQRELRRMEKGEVTQAILIFSEEVDEPTKKTLLAAEKEARSDKLQLLKLSSEKAQESVNEFFNKRGKDYFTGVKQIDFEPLFVKRLPLLNTMVVPMTPKLVEEIAAQPNVLGILPNQPCKLIQPFKTDPKAIVRREVRDGITWGLKRLKMDKIWEQGFKGAGVRIGHLDTGVYPDHPELSGKVVEWMAFSPQGVPLQGCPIYDSDFHGTHTAGTLVGGGASGVQIGVAPDAKLVSGQVLQNGGGTLTQVLSGINWIIEQDIQVLSMSLGFSRYEPKFAYYVERLLLLDIFPSFAIGNAGWGNTSSPGNISLACGIGAINYESEIAAFSSGGSLSFYDKAKKSTTHVIKPDVCAPGVAVFSAVPPLMDGVEINGNFYAWLDGTSMATPHVAGIAALLTQAVPEKRAVEIMEALYQTAKPAGELGHNNRYGRGIIDPLKALQKLTST